jgi:hypothetical protein
VGTGPRTNSGDRADSNAPEQFVKLCVRGRSGLACEERPEATQAVYRPPLLAQRFVVVIRQIGRPFV